VKTLVPHQIPDAQEGKEVQERGYKSASHKNGRNASGGLVVDRHSDLRVCHGSSHTAVRLALQGIWKCESIANQGQGFPVTFQKVEFSMQGIETHLYQVIMGSKL